MNAVGKMKKLPPWVQKKLWLAKLKEHPRVNIGPARDGHDMIMASAGDGVVRCTCRGDKTWNTGTVVNGNLAEHHKGGAAQASGWWLPPWLRLPPSRTTSRPVPRRV